MKKNTRLEYTYPSNRASRRAAARGKQDLTVISGKYSRRKGRPVASITYEAFDMSMQNRNKKGGS